MRVSLRRTLTFANVCSMLALTVAVGTGGAYAANSVFSDDIVDGEVKSVDLAAKAVTSPKLGGNAVTTAKIDDGAILPADVAAANVDGEPGAPSLRTLGTGAAQAAAGDDARLSDARAPTGAAGGALTGAYPTPGLATDSVGMDQIAHGAVGPEEINHKTIIYDPSTVPAQGCVSNSVFFSDAVSPSIVIAQSALPPGVFVAGSSGAGTNLYVKLCNVSTTARNPGSSTFSVTLV